MPAQDRIRCDEGRDLAQKAAAKLLALDRQSPALLIREADALAAELLPEDPVLGHAIKAYVVLREKDGVSIAELEKHCTRWLEPFARPKFIEIVDELPHGTSGKVLRRALSSESPAKGEKPRGQSTEPPDVPLTP